MLFYLCSIPRNVLEFDTVQDVVMERYEHYTSKAGEYDISPDSDVLGHFIMCLVANKSPLLCDIIRRGETELFINKLTVLNADEITNELNCALTFLTSLDQIEGSASLKCKLQQYRILVKNILTVVKLKGKHVFRWNHKRTCYKYEILVPFTFPLRLVAKRQINVVQGKAKVPCGLWSELLIDVFQLFLGFEVAFFSQFYLLQYMIYESEDDRLRGIIDKVMKSMLDETSLVSKDMSADDIDSEIQYFPPCMLNLHKILRQTHRLSYFSRYQYTLFLKDIGLPAKENVSFWKSEYTKPHNSSSCTHNWDEKVSRYEYQILHLYGLVGTTVIKTSHSCDKFIDKLTLRMDGGCPFVHFTKDTLFRSFLNDFCERDVEDIMSHMEGDKPWRACAVYFLRKHGHPKSNENVKITEMISPLHYYKLAKGSRVLNHGGKHIMQHERAPKMI